MTKAVDNRIELLQKKVEEKRTALENKKNSIEPTKTNLILHLEDQTYNLHALNKQALTLLLIKLQTMVTSLVAVEKLEDSITTDSFLLEGHPLHVWMDDVIFKIRMLSVKEEEKQLKQMEKVLESKLSEERKLEIELDEMEAMLK